MSGIEWELYKENVKPCKEGRKVNLLNEALKSFVKSESDVELKRYHL